MVFISYLTILKNRSANYKQVINEHSGAFLEKTTKSIAHRLLRTPVDLRQGLTINEIVDKLSLKANEVGVNYNPHAIRSFKMAVMIEKSKLLSWLFLQFKRIYSKPIYQ
jgi:hypothetical protein